MKLREEAAGPQAPYSRPESERAWIGWYVTRAGDDPIRRQEIVNVDDNLFVSPLPRTLLRAMRQLIADGLPITPTSVLPAALRIDPALSHAGFYGLLDAAEDVGSPVVYLRDLRECAARGLLDAYLQTALAQVRDAQVDPAAVLAGLRRFCDDAPPPGRRFVLLDRAAILARADPEPLVDGVFFRDTIACLYGPSETAKTFVALHVALSIASGREKCLGHAVRHQGHTVYVAAEGAAGIKQRLLAWEAHHDIEVPSTFYLITETPNVLESGDVDALVGSLQTLPEPPVLVVLDTLNRCLAGGNENDPKDMSMMIRAADRLRRAFPRCVVLIIHHPNAEGTRARGHSSFHNALDTMVQAECAGTPDTDPVRLTCAKQKDAAHFERMLVRCLKVRDSLVPALATDPRDEPAPSGNALTALQVLIELSDAGGDAGVTYAAWLRATTLAKSSFKLVRDALRRGDWVWYDSYRKRYEPTESGKRFRRFSKGSPEPSEPWVSGGSCDSPPLKGVNHEPNPEPPGGALAAEGLAGGSDDEVYDL